MVESSLVILDHRMIDYNVGNGGSVEFNFFNVWGEVNYRKKFNCLFYPGELVFYHVHPANLDKYSITDLNCMQGFYISFGMNIYFSIILFENSDIDCLKYIQIDYVYNGKGVVLSSNNNLTNEQLLILKLLSYGSIHNNEVEGCNCCK